MNIIFEIEKSNTPAIEDIRSNCGEIIETYTTKGLNSTEIVAIVVALIPTIKDLIMKYHSHPNIVIKMSNEFGSVEISATSLHKAEKQLEAALKMLKEKSADQSTSSSKGTNLDGNK